MEHRVARSFASRAWSGAWSAAFYKRVVRSLVRIGSDRRDSEDIALQKTLMVGVSLTCLVVATIWGFVYVIAGAWMAGAMPLLYAILSLASNVFFGLTRRFAFYRFAQLALILALPWAMMIALGGFHNSSVVVLWSALCPVGALLFEEPLDAARWLVAFLALVVLGAVFQPATHVAPLSPSMIAFFYVMNIGGVLSIIFGMLFYFVEKKNLFQERSETLLLNILPKAIADILKGERRSIAEHYEGVSILFADVVQFTPMASAMLPMELVGLLDEVFMCFDLLAEKYTLEKIKTIGDCYMVASGVPAPRADHAHALARMALEMRLCIGDREFKGRRLAFRIGMNSGPVVAGIIGRKKFIYDLWGDAVNTASRMEAHGESGAIQITRRPTSLSRTTSSVKRAAPIDIKGKGAMEVWHLAGEKDRVRGSPLRRPDEGPMKLGGADGGDAAPARCARTDHQHNWLFLQGPNRSASRLDALAFPRRRARDSLFAVFARPSGRPLSKLGVEPRLRKSALEAHRDLPAMRPPP